MKSFAALLIALVGFMAHADVTAKDPMPTKILTCGGSIINQIGGRLEGDTKFETGASVFMNNKVASVAYQEDPSIPAIRDSKVGDHVLVCLVFVPKNCPKGDDRGSIYTVTNLRTLESWTLPDSEHSCGGA